MDTFYNVRVIRFWNGDNNWKAMEALIIYQNQQIPDFRYPYRRLLEKYPNIQISGASFSSYNNLYDLFTNKYDSVVLKKHGYNLITDIKIDELSVVEDTNPLNKRQFSEPSNKEEIARFCKEQNEFYL